MCNFQNALFKTKYYRTCVLLNLRFLHKNIYQKLDDLEMKINIIALQTVKKMKFLWLTIVNGWSWCSSNNLKTNVQPNISTPP